MHKGLTNGWDGGDNISMLGIETTRASLPVFLQSPFQSLHRPTGRAQNQLNHITAKKEKPIKIQEY
jgi:hypothetical protein